MGALVMFLGYGLIIVNGSASGQLQTVWSFIYDPTPAAQGSQVNLELDLLAIIGEFLFVTIGATVADNSSSAGAFIITFIIALWVLWAVKNPSLLSEWSQALSGQALRGQGRTS